MKRFYLSSDGGTYCNGVYDTITDVHIPPWKIIAIVNRLYELDKKFILSCLSCDYEEEDMCYGESCCLEDECIYDYYQNSYDVESSNEL